MLRKSVFILALLCSLAVANSAMAVDWSTTVVWHGDTDANWFNPDGVDWVHNGGQPNGTIPPDANTFVVIEPPKGPDPIIDGDASCSALSVCNWSWAGASARNVILNSGTLNAGEYIGLGNNGDWDGLDANSAGLIVNGGTVTTPTQVAANGLYIGGGGSTFAVNYGKVKMNGGLISVPRINLYHGDIALYGGTLENTSGEVNFVFYQNHPENRIDISGGTLRVAGNMTTTLGTLITNKRIYSSRGNIGTPTFTSPWTTLTSADVNMLPAYSPTPEANATNVHYRVSDVNNPITLSWSAGDINVINTAVYFGTSSADVTAATRASSQFQGDVNEANTVVLTNGEPNTWNINYNFKVGTAYYWRVDVNSIVSFDGLGNPVTRVTKGRIWMFTTHDGKAYNANPYDTKTNLSEPLQLSWTAGDFAVSHRVFFGTLSTGILNASTSNTDGRYRGTVSSPFYPLSRLAEIGANPPGASYTLVPGTTYYWRIDEVNGTTVWKGNTWSFTPAPYVNIDDFEDYNTTAELQAHWATTYPVNCDADYPVSNGAVTFVNDTDGKHMRFHYYDKGGLGDLWFSEARYAYNPGTSFTGSGVLVPAPAALSMSYIGSPLNSVNETYDRMYVAIQDTAGNIGVYQNQDSSAATVEVWTAWLVNLKDINAAGIPSVVKLKDVNAFYLGFGARCLPGPGGDGNVMFDNIRLYAQTCNAAYATAHGLLADLNGDCTVDINDLDVFADSWLYSAENRTFVSYTAPHKAPVLWYKFDDTDLGGSVIDYGTGDANVYTGTVTRFAPLCWNPTGSRSGGPCLYLPSPAPHNSHPFVNAPVGALSFIDDDAHSLANGGGGATFSVWMNASFPGDFYTQWGSLFGPWDSNGELLEVPCPSRVGPGYSGSQGQVVFMKHDYHSAPAVSINCGTYRPLLDFGGRWNHWVFMKATDTPLPGYSRMSIYLNGLMIANTDANGLPGDPNAFVFGKLWNTDHGLTAFKIATRGDNWAEWAGKLNDFQVYDYALSDAEIAYLATDGTGSLLLRLDTAANMVTTGAPADQVINFADLAEMCSEWRQTLLWP